MYTMRSFAWSMATFISSSTVNVLGCLHTVAQKAVNMFQGEKNAYALYTHKLPSSLACKIPVAGQNLQVLAMGCQGVHHQVGSKVCFCSKEMNPALIVIPQRHVKFLWQNIICKYWPWAAKESITKLAHQFASAVKEMSPALSVIHAKTPIFLKYPFEPP